jgi:hypothetical protein
LADEEGLSADEEAPESAWGKLRVKGGAVRGEEEALFIADRQVGGSTLAAGGGDAFPQGVQVTEGCG